MSGVDAVSQKTKKGVEKALRGTTSVPELVHESNTVLDYENRPDGDESRGDHPIFSINDKQIRHINTLNGTNSGTNTVTNSKKVIGIG